MYKKEESNLIILDDWRDHKFKSNGSPIIMVHDDGFDLSIYIKQGTKKKDFDFMVMHLIHMGKTLE